MSDGSLRRRQWLALLPVSVAAVLLSACGDDAPVVVETRPASEAASETPLTSTPATPREQEPPPGPPKRLFAKKFIATVRAAPDKDAPRIGFLRGGAVLRAKTAAPLGTEACRKGWYELETGGFVCSTVDVIAFDGERLPERRPVQPDRAALMPYPYGYSRRKGTPVFRELPTDEEAAVHEGIAVPPSDPAAPPVTQAVAPLQAAGMPGGGVLASPDAGVTTLASLQGEEGSVLLRRMERGFYVSLDEVIGKGRRRYWRTQANGFIPFDRLVPVRPTEFRGVHLEPGAFRLPIGFLLSSHYWAYRLDDRGRLRKAGQPGYHHVFEITGEAEIRADGYFVASDGRYYRPRDATRIEARPKPEEVRPDEKWIDVDLATQSLVAYVGDRPVFATLVSTGRVEEQDDPLEDLATPNGAFRITSKHLSATMDGDHALDGPYSIEDVPYVMYFELAYALHAAFWHNAFGRPRSHGCINLAPDDARWLFDWAAPVLPVAWHSVYPTEREPGTRLYVRGETPEG